MALGTAMKSGFALAGVWAVVLVAAFVIYPEPDNLITGIFVYLIAGVDGLNRVSVLGAAAISIGQTAFCFGLGYLIGRFMPGGDPE